MANSEYPRAVSAYVGINGVNVWGDIKDYVRELTYIDVASGETDSFDILLHDVNDHWLNDWLIDKGTLIDAKIKLKNWEYQGDDRWTDCGEFLCDSLGVKGFPLDISIKTLALPVQGTKNTKKWENITISAIAQDICNHLGVELLYYADDLKLKSRQQSQQTDINFLYSLCNEYGLGMKVFRHKIVIFDLAEYDKVIPAVTYILPQIIDDNGFSLTDNEDGTYTGVKATYKIEGSDNSKTYTLGTSEKMIVLDNAGSSLKEAEIKAKAALYKANVEAVKLKFVTTKGIPFYSGTNYYFYGIGKYSGAYGIDKVTHSIDETNGYSVTVEAHAIALEKDRKPAETAINKQSSEITQGKKIELSGCPLYVSSDASSPVRYVSGTYYLYDGKDFNGRYRITNDSSRVGKTPVNKYVTGYIDSKYA